MTPEQAAHELATAVFTVPGRFMTDPATFARGAELGFEGMDFYIAGRGGALGEVPADVVVASLVFFAPEVIRPSWERSAPVMPRRAAAQEWAACGHVWARAHMGDGPDYARFAALLGRVVDRASVAGAPVFAGWRTLTEPDDAKALAQHHFNALRELRGALHGAAVLTVGLLPVEAIVVKTPAMATIFGWPEPHPAPDPLRDRWRLAEARTDRMVGKYLALLDADERAELVSLTSEIASAVH